MIGTCREMCPSSEIRLRERENLLHRFEVAEDHTRQRPKADWNKCVKEYRRPTVGTRDPRPEEIRPPDVLVETLDYLVHRNSPPLKAAFDMSQAFSQKNWVRVFHKFAGVTSPVHICAVHRHFPALHRMALSMMSTAFSSKNLKFPISKLTELLFLNTHMETQNLCVQYGIKVQGENVQFLKGDFKTDAKIERCQSDFINQILKAMTIPDILKGKHSTSTVINAGNSTIGRSHFDQNEHF
ncbi:SAC31-like protein [Mya arenaria]|uniref:SAC31-like protein n=1 Tax=Mya arenaria TaxID=6604 RepID=A0ABY7EQL7_MYAAR|nr:SAC31-like protein [Mya arenaria]